LPITPAGCADEKVVTTDYQPISCISHERLELAVLKKQWLDIHVLAGEAAGMQHLMPLDVYAQAGVEWLKAQTESGKTLTLRLDQIRF
jgi:Rho-binding antiterminator